ncbi:MAG TPA: cation:proton antiporter [Lacunisphaera sp.]|nr:cation:proton antiporter [Lacunisphaera sp.]
MHGIELIQDLAVVMLVATVAGWLCQRIGLSMIVGYLVAGMIIGPYTPPFSLVTDGARIETLSQLGLVFLMFGIGLHLSLRRLKQMGLPLVVATAVNTVLIYYLCLMAGGAMGWGRMETHFLAGMLMISSSAIIGKILVESGLTHDRVGQAAMGLTIMEDVVAVVMLTLLSSMAKFGTMADGARIGSTIGIMVAFVVLAGVASLLVVPWLLRRLAATVSVELQTLCVAALMLGLAVIAARAGYSLALGAFLLGCVVAETAQRTQVVRTFEGIHDVFSVVFFVSIGMQIDVRMLGQEIGLILGVSLFSLLLRPLTCMAGFLVAGAPMREAFRIGVVATPIGEFSLIIAQLGVTTAAVPARFYPLAVGVSLITSLAAPPLTRHSARIADVLLDRTPAWLNDALLYYQRWLEQLQQFGKKSILWQLSKKRFIQIAVEMLLVTGLLVFSGQMLGLVRHFLPVDHAFPRGAEVIFWSILALVALPFVIAIWRNFSALALLYAQVSAQGFARSAKLEPVIEAGLKVCAGLLLLLWLSAVLPGGGMARWLPLIVLVVLLLGFLVLRRRMIYWHSLMVAELQDMLERKEPGAPGTTAPWLTAPGDWNLKLTGCILPDLADCRGRSLGELALRTRFGCTVAGIERQGVLVGNPNSDMILYPRDKVLLLGDPQQVADGKAFLQLASGAPVASHFDEVRMETIEVPPGSGLRDRTLAELALGRAFGVQVAGIRRGGQRILNPRSEEKIRAGDSLLVLGSPEQIAAFHAGLVG